MYDNIKFLNTLVYTMGIRYIRNKVTVKNHMPLFYTIFLEKQILNLCFK